MATRVSLEPIDDGRVAVIKTALAGDRHNRQAEAEWLARARHRGVVRLLDVTQNPTRIRTLHAGNTTMRTGTPTPAHAAHLLTDAAVTLADLHDRGMVHGQITLDHLVIDQARIVLCSPTGVAEDPQIDIEDLGHCVEVMLDRWEESECEIPELDDWRQLAAHLTEPEDGYSARRAARELARLAGQCDRDTKRADRQRGTDPQPEEASGNRLQTLSQARGLVLAGLLAVVAIAGSFSVLAPGTQQTDAGPQVVVAGSRYQLGDSEHDEALVLSDGFTAQRCSAATRDVLEHAVAFLDGQTGSVWLFDQPGGQATAVAIVPGATALTSSEKCGSVWVEGPAGHIEVELAGGPTSS